MKDLKHIVGMAESGKEATIKLFGPIDKDVADRFISEFDWLQEYVKPSSIKVLINSEGGYVTHGMSIFSVILNATVPTLCVNEGMAASMASVIWCASDNRYMRDYAILMIHNPFNSKSEGESDAVSSMKKQLETIYRKRFGMSVDTIRSIMDGEEGKDGTFFTANEAVSAGFISKDNVIMTPKTISDKVKSQIDGVSDIHEIQNVMASVIAEIDEDKLSEKNDTSLNQKENLSETKGEINNQNNTKKMDENKEKTIGFEIGAVAASLGFSQEFQVSDVMAKIQELKGVEAKLEAVNAELNGLKTIVAGKDTAISNLQSDLATTQASLQVYIDAEEAKKKQDAVDMVKAAIADLKIEPETEKNWVDMALANPALVKATLDSIPPKKSISQQIADDPINVKGAKENLTEVEAKVKEKVNQVVGEGFAFKKLA